VTTTAAARTHSDLDRAAGYLAQAVAILGVIAFFSLLTKAGAKSGRGGGGGPGEAGAASAGEAAKPAAVRSTARASEEIAPKSKGAVGSGPQYSETEGLQPKQSAETLGGDKTSPSVQADTPPEAVSPTEGPSVPNVVPRGLPPQGISPPAASPCRPGPASRPSEASKGGQSLWDQSGGEWRWFPGDKYHNPHWDYNPHATPSSPWENVPHGGLPPVKPPTPNPAPPQNPPSGGGEV
jgi:hypothetical protein